MADGTASLRPPLIDRFNRAITYLRLSVTDRCDLRCSYCMAEHMTFLPKMDLLSLDELDRVARAFIDRGVRKLRITGGEPLVRRDILELIDGLGPLVGGALDELTLTTNATRLEGAAERLRAAGMRRVNVSLDSLDPVRFAEITRRGRLDQVLAGIAAAKAAGLRVKINTVALKHQNAEDIPAIVEWAHSQGHDMTLIEVMPLGLTGEDRYDQFIALSEVRAGLAARWTLIEEDTRSAHAGPSRYVRVAETGGRLGFITPLSNNFCAGCNRVRVTCTGRIYMCLGQDDHVDLRAALRDPADPAAALDRALQRAMGAKPERHDFEIRAPGEAPALPRHMSVTGG